MLEDRTGHPWGSQRLDGVTAGIRRAGDVRVHRRARFVKGH